MKDNQLAKYSAKIKNVYIEVKDYKFFHSPYLDEDSKERFIGRESVKNRIITILEYTKTKSGSYLITGFRGMGKTSVVREAIGDYNKKKDDENEKKNQKTTNKSIVVPVIKTSKIIIGYIVTYILILNLLGNWNAEICKELSNAAFLCKNNLITMCLFLILLGFSAIWAKKDSNNSNKNLREYYNKIFIRFFFITTICIFLHFLFFYREFEKSLQTTLVIKHLLLVALIFHTFLAQRFAEIFEATWSFFRVLLVTLLLVVLYNFLAGAEESFYNLRLNKILRSTAEMNVYQIIVSLLLFYIIISLVVFINDLVALIYAKLTIFPLLSEKDKNKGYEKYEKFEINLSQDSINEMDVLRRMTIAVEKYWIKNRYSFSNHTFNRKIYFPWRLILSMISRPRQEGAKPSYESILTKLSVLRNRMSGQVTSKKEAKISPEIKTEIGGLGEVALPLGSFTNNNEISYPIANTKEAEDLLHSVLEDIDTLRTNEKGNIPQFAFIIDELDKVEPYDNSVVQEKEAANPLMDKSRFAQDTNRFRERREAVARLLANLKGFLNVAAAKFFFIGGREMYDANLADIADRESFYSSIFNDVIYVESFFKDSPDLKSYGAGGITQMTEAYICKIILKSLGSNKKQSETRELSLKRLYELLSDHRENCLIFTDSSDKSKATEKDSNKYDEIKKQKYKVLFTLQNYIIYLTYRSNGTPKKLTGLTEQLIVNGPADKEKNKEFFENNVVVLHEPEEEEERRNFDPSKTDLSKKRFIKFGFNTQYEIGLTANLYRPYLITNSRHLKSLGDKLLFSSSFIIDHILKFHPFGFSWRNLELIPEIVLVNREPNLREFIEELMRFYSLNYIRDTVSGIFDYRFRSIIRRELVHLSKTSDLSSAAFNFTLDESLSTKRHFKRKIIELQQKYAEYTQMADDNHFVHSLCFFQTILGDLHYYDKEYDEAVYYYTESIQTLRLPDVVTNRKMTRHQFLLWLRNKLKLALTLEKMRAFDSAFSIYKTLTLDTGRYLKNIVSKKDSDEISEHPANPFSRDAEDHRTIQLVCMPFIALLAVVEKARNDGITYANLLTNRKDFLKTINADSDSFDGDIKFDSYRKYYLMADYYNNVGSILFYKNCQYSKFWEKSSKDCWLDVFQDKTGVSNDSEQLVCWLDKTPGDNGRYIIDQQNDLYDKNAEKRPYDYFPSLTSFNYYWNSLYFLLKYHQERIIEKLKQSGRSRPAAENRVKLEDNLLALCAAYLLPECVDMVSANRLYYIANIVSKIGDSILASLKKDQFTIESEKSTSSTQNASSNSDLEKSEVSTQDTFSNRDKENLEKTVKNRENHIKKFRELLNRDEIFTAETVLYTYKLAAALYKKTGYTSYYASHLIRILYVIKDLIAIDKGLTRQNTAEDIEKSEEKLKVLNEFLNFIENNFTESKDKPDSIQIPQKEILIKKVERVAEMVLKATTWNNEVSNRPQILKYREIFNIKEEERDRDRELIYNNLNNISDNKEVIVLVESIRMKLFNENLDKFIKDFTRARSIISAYGPMNNRYQRMLELKYRMERCYFLMRKVLKLDNLFEAEMFKADAEFPDLETVTSKIQTVIENKEDISIDDVVEFLIQDALFCSSQLIKMIRLYNPGYIIGYSFIAEAHKRMGDWCQVYDNYLEILDQQTKKDKFKEDTKKMLDSDDLAYVEPKNNYETAIQYYYKMLQLHSDGKSYKDKLHEIYMLEDDYNDNMAHYTIAAERLRINTELIRDKIIRLEEKVGISKVYAYDSYLSSEKREVDADEEKNSRKKKLSNIRIYRRYLSQKIPSS